MGATSLYSLYRNSQKLKPRGDRDEMHLRKRVKEKASTSLTKQSGRSWQNYVPRLK